MKRSLTSTVLVAALIAAVALPSFAQDPRPDPGQAPAMTAAPGPAHGGMAGQPGLRLAAHLSALETLVGITAEQAPAWRGYTDALLAFAGPGRPQHGAPPDGRKGERPQEKGHPQLLMGEMMAGRAMADAGRAEALKQAATALRAVLSEGQLARLIEAERPPMPHSGPERGPERRPQPQGPADRG